MPDVINIGRKNQAGNSIGIIQLPNITQFGAVAAGGTGLCNIVTGTDTFGVGFRGNPGAYGSSDNVDPTPPGVGGTALLQISQFNGLNWQIRFQPAVIAQAAWTSVTLVGSGSITLFSAAAAYTPNSFGSSLWSFAATADVWNGLGVGQNVTATFA